MEVVTSQQHYVATAPVTSDSKQNGIPTKLTTSAAATPAVSTPNKISSAAGAVAMPATGSHHSNHTPSTSNTQNSSSSSQRQQRPSSTTVANSPGTPNRHVNFGGGGDAEEKKREKFLTAKYGAHQMALIRKRLRVEMWMYERLQELYGADDIEIDLDEVLDMDDESDRRTYISELLRIDGKHPCTKAERVNVFVGDLLEKVKTL